MAPEAASCQIPGNSCGNTFRNGFADGVSCSLVMIKRCKEFPLLPLKIIPTSSFKCFAWALSQVDCYLICKFKRPFSFLSHQVQSSSMSYYRQMLVYRGIHVGDDMSDSTCRNISYSQGFLLLSNWVMCTWQFFWLGGTWTQDLFGVKVMGALTSDPSRHWKESDQLSDIWNQ